MMQATIYAPDAGQSLALAWMPASSPGMTIFLSDQ